MIDMQQRQGISKGSPDYHRIREAMVLSGSAGEKALQVQCDFSLVVIFLLNTHSQHPIAHLT